MGMSCSSRSSPSNRVHNNNNHVMTTTALHTNVHPNKWYTEFYDDQQTYFVQACRRGDIIGITNLETYNYDWSIGLESVARGGHLHLIEFFMQKTPSFIRYKALKGAIRGRHEQLVYDLFRRYDICFSGGQRFHAPYWAAKYGMFNFVKYYHKHYPQDFWVQLVYRGAIWGGYEE